jgi:hypothetical protein
MLIFGLIGCTHSTHTDATQVKRKGGIIGIVHLPENVKLNEPVNLEVTVTSVSGETILHLEEFNDNRDWPVEFEVFPRCFASPDYATKAFTDTVNVIVRVRLPGRYGFTSDSHAYSREDSERGRRMNILLVPMSS